VLSLVNEVSVASSMKLITNGIWLLFLDSVHAMGSFTGNHSH